MKQDLRDSVGLLTRSHFIGKVRQLQTVELNETGVETTYQLISSSLAFDTNSD